MDTLNFVIGAINVLVENFIIIYFLHNRFASKNNSHWPQTGVYIFSFLIAILAYNSHVIYTLTTIVMYFIYLIIYKIGTTFQKLLGIIMFFAIILGTSIIGASIISILFSTTMGQVTIYNDTIRSMTLIFIKTMQVVIFYFLTKRHEKNRRIKASHAYVLGVIIIAAFTFLLMIRYYAESPDLSPSQYPFLVWLSVSALFVVLAVFFIYELFIHEESKNIDLAMKLQRYDLESGFQKEIDRIYSYMRTWQHDYGNNLCALRAFMENGENEKALDYINEISDLQAQDQVTIKTGNLVLDAIITSKLWLAKSKNIDVNMQVVYPDNKYISDNDLCAVLGNLIDNSIEACDRMGDATNKKFIDLSILPKKKNLIISVRNSYNHEIKLKGKRYLTTKQGPHHGIGIPHIESIINKYHGIIERSHDDGIFETIVLLPLESPAN